MGTDLVEVPFDQKDDLQIGERLLRRANQNVPDEMVRRILDLIDGENERDGYFVLAKEVEVCWSMQLGAALLEKSKSADLKPQILSAVLEILIERQFPGTRESAEGRLEAVSPESSPAQNRAAVAAAQVLMRRTPDAGWARIWPLFKKYKDIGREIVESISYGFAGGTNFVAKLSDKQAGELYLWMVETYPYVERKLLSGAVGPVDTTVMLRDGILEQLKNRATFAARDAIGRAMENFPQYPWLRHHLEQAESLARAATWQPISSSHFLALAQN